MVYRSGLAGALFAISIYFKSEVVFEVRFTGLVVDSSGVFCRWVLVFRKGLKLSKETRRAGVCSVPFSDSLLVISMNNMRSL